MRCRSAGSQACADRPSPMPTRRAQPAGIPAIGSAKDSRSAARMPGRRGRRPPTCAVGPMDVVHPLARQGRCTVAGTEQTTGDGGPPLRDARRVPSHRPSCGPRRRRSVRRTCRGLREHHRSPDRVGRWRRGLRWWERSPSGSLCHWWRLGHRSARRNVPGQHRIRKFSHLARYHSSGFR